MTDHGFDPTSSTHAPTQPLLIRGFRAADQAAARTLVLAGLAERWGAAMDPARNTDLDDITASYCSGAGGGLFVVAHLGDKLVATGALTPEEEEEEMDAEGEAVVDMAHDGQACSRGGGGGGYQGRRATVPTARISRMSVAKEHRAQGVGGRVLAWLMNEARERGFRRVVCETTKTWIDAVRFYERRGFRMVREDEHDRHFEVML
ncbi:hypothetical protein HK405_013555 [Cladochytrium tenue]|nr:hypothetical protein HK405_013555 [Cladochytrium tenue]